MQPDTLRGPRIATAAYFGTETGLHFCLPMTKAQANQVYGPAAIFFRPTEGLIGHRVGKSATRARLNLRRMRPHWAVGHRERDLTDLRFSPHPTMALLHSINTDFEGLRAKLAWLWLRRAASLPVLSLHCVWLRLCRPTPSGFH